MSIRPKAMPGAVFSKCAQWLTAALAHRADPKRFPAPDSALLATAITEWNSTLQTPKTVEPDRIGLVFYNSATNTCRTERILSPAEMCAVMLLMLNGDSAFLKRNRKDGDRRDYPVMFSDSGDMVQFGRFITDAKSGQVVVEPPGSGGLDLRRSKQLPFKTEETVWEEGKAFKGAWRGREEVIEHAVDRCRTLTDKGRRLPVTPEQLRSFLDIAFLLVDDVEIGSQL